MAKRPGRPRGTSGRAAVLSASQVRHVFRVARARSRHAARAEAALAMSLGVGLRAKELTSLQWADVYDAEGRVRPVLHLRAAYTKGGKTRDVFLSSPALRRVLSKYGDGRWMLSARTSHAPLFPSQHPDDRRVRRGQPAATRPHPAGRDVVSAGRSRRDPKRATRLRFGRRPGLDHCIRSCRRSTCRSRCERPFPLLSWALTSPKPGHAAAPFSP